MEGTTAHPTLSLTTADAVHQRKHDWNIRHVRWGDVLRYQHWGGLLILVPAVVIIGVSHFTFQDKPVERQALLYDATISFPLNDKQTIPNSLAVVYNWICLVLAVLVIELLLLRKQHSLTTGITGVVHQVWCCAISFVVVVAVAEISKAFSGRLRPDFLARCQPQELVENSAANTGPYASNLPPVLSRTTLGPVHLGQVAGACTNPNLEEVKDGRLSFPSGHASNSMAVAWFTAIYVIWSMYLRHDAPYPGRLRPGLRKKQLPLLRHIIRRIIQELWHALVYAFVLLALCLSWFIGLTRFWDNVHNISDILGGFLLAIIFTTPFAIKAIGLHGCIQMLIDGPNGSTAAQNGAPTVAQHTAEDTLVLPRIVQDTVPMGTVPGNGGVGVGQAGGGVPKKGLGHGGADHTAVDVAPASLRG